MNDLLKGLYYSINRPSLKEGYQLSLGFIFHTERIYNPEVFLNLVTFCKAYRKITNKKPLCVVMSPTNKRVFYEMQKASFNVADFEIKLEELSAYADLGYHGHFWRSNENFEHETSQVKMTNFTDKDAEFIEDQFASDYNWLKKFDYVKPYFAAGWWFINPEVLRNLGREKIIADFSFSQLNWVSNDWTKGFMRKNGIMYGQSFQLNSDKEQPLTCVQTLMGAPNSKHPEDFLRIINTYLDENTTPMGMIATHDYNLIEGNTYNTTIKLVECLMAEKNISFFSADELVERSLMQGKKIVL